VALTVIMALYLTIGLMSAAGAVAISQKLLSANFVRSLRRSNRRILWAFTGYLKTMAQCDSKLAL
jgi:hypothetical protein